MNKNEMNLENKWDLNDGTISIFTTTSVANNLFILTYFILHAVITITACYQRYSVANKPYFSIKKSKDTRTKTIIGIDYYLISHDCFLSIVWGPNPNNCAIVRGQKVRQNKDIATAFREVKVGANNRFNAYLIPCFPFLAVATHW